MHPKRIEPSGQTAQPPGARTLVMEDEYGDENGQLRLLPEHAFSLLPSWLLERDGREVCWSCRRERTPEGHDPCIARLPGVVEACCGHGAQPPYVVLARYVGYGRNLQPLYGFAAAAAFRELRAGVAVPLWPSWVWPFRRVR